MDRTGWQDSNKKTTSSNQHFPDRLLDCTAGAEPGPRTEAVCRNRLYQNELPSGKKISVFLLYNSAHVEYLR